MPFITNVFMRLIRFTVSALLLTLVFLVRPSPGLAFEVPANDGYYTQTTPILTVDQEAAIESELTEIERTTSNEIAVLLVESLHDEPIEDAANLVFRTWGIGKSDRNNGILLLVATADHTMRIEVGYGLEGAVPDIVAKGIIDNDIAPPFREGKYNEGLLAGIDALKKHVSGEYTMERYAEADDDGGFFPLILFFVFVFMNLFGAWMARTKSWWLGGVLGGVFGLILAIAFSWWLAIPFLVLLGLGFDFVLSKFPNAYRRGRGGFWGGGMGGGTGGSSSGGFGGFSGGSSGGGGASGGW